MVQAHVAVLRRLQTLPGHQERLPGWGGGDFSAEVGGGAAI